MQSLSNLDLPEATVIAGVEGLSMWGRVRECDSLSYIYTSGKIISSK